MNRLRTIVLSLVVAGCGVEQVARVEPEQVAADAPFVAGERYRYRFAWNVSTRAHDAWRIDGAAVSGGVDMAGLLDVHALGSSPDGWVFACSFAQLDRRALSSFGVDALAGTDAARRLVGPQAWLVVDPSGVRAPIVRFDRESPSVFRHLMGGLLVHLDLAAPRDGRAREATVPVGQGLGEVTYV
ncbi:MAG TPA: hypothetical protein VG755_02350, partial [Nannocystaceae bacterium]|nr:hypothetical protein [Nannocystaceae bacterium]